MKIRRSSKVWNLHSHSAFSVNDALPKVEDMVKTVAGYGQKALGLTDHGNMAGAVQLYKSCREYGLTPFPGSELYVVHDRNDQKAKRHHMCVVAYTTEGYKNLVKLSTRTHENFYHKPLIDHADLAEMSENGMLRGIAATSGCYFGFIAQAVARGDSFQARQLMATYDGWFDKFYVELQNHNIDHGDGHTDDSLADELFVMAHSMGIPAVLTQDSHYCHQHEQGIHNELKRLVAFGPEADEAVFPGDGFGLADTAWFKDHHSDERYAYGEAGLEELLASNDLAIPELDKYHYNIPFTVPDPDKTLRDRCERVLKDRGLGNDKRHVARLEEELAVIKDTGMAGYLLLVAEVTDWLKANRIFYQARGSASGSEACWMLGITQADPIKWGLSFERFISRDRMKPPDIDLDVEHNRRKDLIEYLSGRFNVVQIGTWSEYSLHGEDDDEDNAKGSLRVKYYSSANQRGKPVASWDQVPQADKDALYQLASYKSFASYGTHAAGLVVTTTAEELASLVPMMWIASSEKMVTQYEMDDIEALGLVKLDALGLRTLSVLHTCMDNLGRDVFDGLDWIPLSDAKTYSRISSGHTAGVFQLEGFTATKGCQKLKPTTIKDVIAAMALFRPAVQDSGETDVYLRRKHKSETIIQRHDMLMKHTSKTYGVMLFQEQVIAILRELGMDPQDLTKFLKAVKASNSAIGAAGDVIASYHDLVKRLADEFGLSDDDFEWLWDGATGFAAYGFNEAHSTAYGLTAYRCAYLSTHHKVEFFAALLEHANTQKDKKSKRSKEDIYLEAARREGIVMRRADVNASKASYSVDSRPDTIRKGLKAIKGVGQTAADEIVAKRPDGGYSSMDEFVHAVDRRKITGVKPYVETGDREIGILGKLIENGAMECLIESE